MKHDTLFKKTANAALDMIGAVPVGSSLPSEHGWATRLSVSRTTVRKILADLAAREVLSIVGKRYVVSRPVTQRDYFPVGEITATSDRVERLFMEWMLRGDRRPGDFINGLDLARRFGVSAGGVREYLNRFSRFGLIERRPNSSWIFRGFTQAFALELCQVRELFETISARAFAALPADAPEWSTLAEIALEHRDLMAQIDTRYHDFSHLDNRFHLLISNVSRNRFFVDFHDVISLIFHYHYQWNKVDEAERNAVAIQEHLTYIDALVSRDPARVEAACRDHLASARQTLLRSIESA